MLLLTPDDRNALVTFWADVFVETPDCGWVDRSHTRADAQEQLDALLDTLEEADDRAASAMLSQIATRLQDAEREHFAAPHPIQWTREEDLLEQHLVS